MEKVISQYTFREKIFKNLKISSESLTQTKVRNYLNKIKEPTSVIINSSILSIVPESKKNLFECHAHLQKNFSPHVLLEVVEDVNYLKQKLVEEVKQQLEEEAKHSYQIPEGIFGDDFHSSIPSTSTVVQKRKFSSISTESNRKKSKVVSKGRFKKKLIKVN